MKASWLRAGVAVALRFLARRARRYPIFAAPAVLVGAPILLGLSVIANIGVSPKSKTSGRGWISSMLVTIEASGLADLQGLIQPAADIGETVPEVLPTNKFELDNEKAFL